MDKLPRHHRVHTNSNCSINATESVAGVILSSKYFIGQFGAISLFEQHYAMLGDIILSMIS